MKRSASSIAPPLCRFSGVGGVARVCVCVVGRVQGGHEHGIGNG